MRVTVFNNTFGKNLSNVKSGVDSDLIVFSNGILGDVDYKSELVKKDGKFKKLVNISAECQCVVIAGCDTNLIQTRKRSAIIVDCGEILGVSDMTHIVDDKYAEGVGLRVYDTSIGKIGLVIYDDLMFFEVARILTLCDADLLITMQDNVENSIMRAIVRSTAYCNGVPVILCARNITEFADIDGEIAYSFLSPCAKFEFKQKKDFHYVSNRRRGFYRAITTPFSE